MSYYERKKKNDKIEEREAELAHKEKILELQTFYDKISHERKIAELVAQEQDFSEKLEKKIQEFKLYVREFMLEKREKEHELNVKQDKISFDLREYHFEKSVEDYYEEYNAYVAQREAFMLDKARFNLEDTRQKLLKSYYDDISSATTHLESLKKSITLARYYLKNPDKLG